MSATQVQEVPTVREALEEYEACLEYAYNLEFAAKDLLSAVMPRARTGERAEPLSSPKAIRLLRELRELKHSK